MNSTIRKALICIGLLAIFGVSVTMPAQQTNPKTGIRWAAAANCGTSGFPYVPADGQCEAPTGAAASIPICIDASGSGTAQSCTTSPSFTPVAGSVIAYITSTSNSASSLTENINSSGAKPVAKWQTTTTLAANDVTAGAVILETFDGTNWELATIGNAPGGSVTGAVLLSPTGGQTIQGASSGVPLVIQNNSQGSSNTFQMGSPGAGLGSFVFDANNVLHLNIGGVPTPLPDGGGGGAIQAGPSFSGPFILETTGEDLNVMSGGGDLQLLAGRNSGDVRSLKLFSTFSAGSIAHNGDVVALGTSDNTVNDCPISCLNPIGVQSFQNGNSTVQTGGIVTVNLDSSQTVAVGDFICTSAITAGLAHDNATAACSTARVGFATSGGTSVTSANVFLR